MEFESQVPVEYNWLEERLNAPHSGQTMVFMHIQPSDVQLEGAPLSRLNDLMLQHQPDAVFMGHLHSYKRETFPGGTPWTTAPWPRREEYLGVQISPDTIIHQRIEL